MELWIRSQDKMDLTKVSENLKIREYSKQEGSKEYFILKNNSLSDAVACYKTKERALEVLDEIQTQLVTLNYQYINIGDHFITTESNVYEMPEE